MSTEQCSPQEARYTTGWRARLKGEPKPADRHAAMGWRDADYRLQYDRRYAGHPARNTERSER